MEIARKIERILARRVNTAPAELIGDKPIVSFSFDDFPKTAYTNAGKILEDNDARGTYFVSTELIGTEYEGQIQCDTQDLQKLRLNGHEIGGHTHSHRQLQTLSKDEVNYEITTNKDYLSNTLDTTASSFAFPFGGVSPKVKRAIEPHYHVARSITPGINRRKFDRMHVNAYALYSKDFCIRRVEKLLEETLRDNAWLVFYTHDVQNKHSAHGCSVKNFSTVINAVKTRKLDILTMSDVSQDRMRVSA